MEYVIKVIRVHDQCECGEIEVSIPEWPVDMPRAQRLVDRIGTQIIKAIGRGERT